jgi:hypothetical protein
MSKRSLALIVAGALALGCGAPGSDDLGVLSQAVDVNNGRMLNGRMLNGRMLNGLLLNLLAPSGAAADVVLIGASYAGAKTAGGVALSKLALQGTRFTTTQTTSWRTTTTLVPDATLVGARLVGSLADGGTVSLRIDGIAPGPAPNADLAVYHVSFWDGARWSPLCGLDAQGAAIAALPVAGRWDLRSGVAGGGAHIDDTARFTFACRGAAIAKCIEIGYRPWATAPNGKGTLADHHQACTRAVRADYCGDGTTWTEDGTLIDVFDDIGVAASTEKTWPVEAAWAPEGAVCIGTQRLPSFELLAAPCFQEAFSFTCASQGFEEGGLIVNRRSWWTAAMLQSLFQ